MFAPDESMQCLPALELEWCQGSYSTYINAVTSLQSSKEFGLGGGGLAKPMDKSDEAVGIGFVMGFVRDRSMRSSHSDHMNQVSE